MVNRYSLYINFWIRNWCWLITFQIVTTAPGLCEKRTRMVMVSSKKKTEVQTNGESDIHPQISLILLNLVSFYNHCNSLCSWMLLIDICTVRIMQNFNENAQVCICIYSLADQNIEHWVELTFFEGKLGEFFVVKLLKSSKDLLPLSLSKNDPTCPEGRSTLHNNLCLDLQTCACIKQCIDLSITSFLNIYLQKL